MRSEAVMNWVPAYCKVWVLVLGIVLWGALSSFRAEAQLRGQQASSDWAQAAPSLPLTPNLRYFKEAPGQPLDWRQALASDAWRDADPKGMSALRQAATMWMQVEVENTGSTAQTRWVVIDYWAMQDVQLFVLDYRQPVLLAQQHAGQGWAPHERALDTTKAAFAVTLEPGQRVRLLMRVSDLYWSHMRVDAWDSAAFIQAETRFKLQFAVVLGAVLALAVVLLLQHNKTFAVVVIWMVLSLLLESTYVGLVHEFVAPARQFSPAMLLLLLGGLINSASSFLTMYFMGLDAHRFWLRWNWVLFGVSLLLALWALDTYSNTTRQALSLMNVIQVFSNLSMLAWAKLRGNVLRQWMAIIMAVNFCLAIARVVVRQFYVEPETFGVLMNAVLLIKGSLVLTVIALVALQRKSEQDKMRLRLQAADREQRKDLQAAVDQRTAELDQALEAANAANRAKTDFLARVSHDLRSPLTSISGYAQLLQRAGGRTGSLAQTIRRSADHMLMMVNDLIEYARGASADRPEPLPVYIHSLLEDVAREACNLAKPKHNGFVLKLETELPPVLVLDAKRLRQMLINLLDNATKFTHHGTVELRVSAQSLSPADGQVKRLELRLAVHDSGEGIAPADQTRLFEPFYRTSSAEGVPGVGLGLSIVQAWAKRLGGSLSLVSALGQGSTFTLRLPVQVASEADLSVHQWQDDVLYLPTLEGGGRQIWVVEDNADIRQLLIEELTDTGFEVLAFTDGAGFLQRMWASAVTPPSLVLTDYLMPGANGADVLRAVRQRWPGVPVVLLSATQKSMPSMGASPGEDFDASLMKPVNLADLRATLAHLLQIEFGRDDLILQPGVPEGQVPAYDQARWARPTAEELERVCQWVAMGALTDLTEWAEALSRRRPECAEFAQQILTLLTQARFDDIRALCAKDAMP